MIPNKASYVDDDTWAKVVKVVSPGIIIIKVINVACVFTILFSLYLTIHHFYLQILFRLFVISKSGGHSSHIMASSFTWMSLMP